MNEDKLEVVWQEGNVRVVRVERAGYVPRLDQKYEYVMEVNGKDAMGADSWKRKSSFESAESSLLQALILRWKS